MSNVVIACGRCGQKNRVPFSRIARGPRCGACHSGLSLAAPLDVDEATLAAAIRESELPLLVDFWAPWCGPCRAVAPVLKEVAARRAGDLLVLKLNVDEGPRAAARHQVSGVPALVLFQGGSERGRLVGAHPRRAIEDLIDGAGRTAPAWHSH